MTNDEITIAVARFKLMPPGQRVELLQKVEHAAKFEHERLIRDEAIQLLPFLQQAEFELQNQFAEMEARITEAVLKRLNIDTIPVESVQPVYVRIVPVRAMVISAGTFIGIWTAVYYIGFAPLLGLSFSGFVVWFMVSAMFGRSRRTISPPPPISNEGGNAATYNNGAIHIESNAGNITITQTFNQ